MATTKSMTFCRAMPHDFERPALWGARAILDERGGHTTLDMVWDRQSAAFDNEADFKRLIAALNEGGAIDRLRTAVREYLVPEETDGSGEITLAGVTFHYAARGGYLYLTAHLAP